MHSVTFHNSRESLKAFQPDKFTFLESWTCWLMIHALPGLCAIGVSCFYGYWIMAKILFACLIAYVLYRYWMVYRQMQHHRKDWLASKASTLHLLPNAFVWCNDDNLCWRYPWGLGIEAKTKGEFLVLEMGHAGIYPIPKTAFESEKDALEFLEAAKQLIAQKPPFQSSTELGPNKSAANGVLSVNLEDEEQRAKFYESDLAQETHQPRHWPVLLVLIVLAFLVRFFVNQIFGFLGDALFLLGLDVENWDNEIPDEWNSFGIPMFFFAFFYPFIFGWVDQLKGRRIDRNQASREEKWPRLDAFIVDHHRLAITPYETIWTTAIVEETAAWSNFVGLRENSDFFVIDNKYDAVGFIIPKENFGSEEEQNEFRSRVQTYVEKSGS